MVSRVGCETSAHSNDNNVRSCDGWQRFAMGLSTKTTDDLVEVAKAGGGFVLDVGRRNTDELVRIAAAARKSGSTIIFRKIAVRKNESLIKIAAAGKGHVIFES